MLKKLFKKLVGLWYGKDRAPLVMGILYEQISGEDGKYD